MNRDMTLCDIGIIGLGVMGKNLLLNIADHGFAVIGFDADQNKVNDLSNDTKHKNIATAGTLLDFIHKLKIPRAILLLVPAGEPVDHVINELIPHLNQGDLIIDAGNSHFTDTDRRLIVLQEKGLDFLGIGISGGEKGARSGPSIMPGGSKNAYKKIEPILKAIAAKVNHEPCVTYLGSGSSGHYVKMVHNGIEYGVMQLIAETYDLLKRGLGLNNNQLAEIYDDWNRHELGSYLLEITANIFNYQDTQTGKFLIDEIVAIADQNGTGMWTSQSALTLQMPCSTIDVAVAMRDLSNLGDIRKPLSQLYVRSIQSLCLDNTLFIMQLKKALYASLIITYAQGFSLLFKASEIYHYHLKLTSIAKIWRGGCIIRAKLLDDIVNAYHDDTHLTHLLLAPHIANQIMDCQEYLRQIVSHASHLGIATPALMSSLAYLDTMRTTASPANLIQAQRDYFGSHTYERIDEKGRFHTQWDKKPYTRNKSNEKIDINR